MTAVDERTNTLTVAPGISGGWLERGNVVDALRPAIIGAEMENTDSVIRIDGQPGKCAPAPSSSPHPRSLPTSLATASPASPSTP